METKPIEIFTKWFDEEIKLTKVNIPSACCLSTIGMDNYPNARFVSILALKRNRFLLINPHKFF